MPLRLARYGVPLSETGRPRAWRRRASKSSLRSSSWRRRGPIRTGGRTRAPPLGRRPRRRRGRAGARAGRGPAGPAAGRAVLRGAAVRRRGVRRPAVLRGAALAGRAAPQPVVRRAGGLPAPPAVSQRTSSSTRRATRARRAASSNRSRRSTNRPSCAQQQAQAQQFQQVAVPMVPSGPNQVRPLGNGALNGHNGHAPNGTVVDATGCAPAVRRSPDRPPREPEFAPNPRPRRLRRRYPRRPSGPRPRRPPPRGDRAGTPPGARAGAGARTRARHPGRHHPGRGVLRGLPPVRPRTGRLPQRPAVRPLPPHGLRRHRPGGAQPRRLHP